MDQGKPLIKGIKCSKHKYQSLDLIDLTGNSDTGRICLVCFQQNKIPHEHCLSISELFEQEEGQILSTYPPFKNEKIREIIQQYCDINIQKSDVDSFFRKLREDIEEAIQSIENKAKQQIIKNENQRKFLIEELNRISETDKLKQLLESSSEKLNEFLQEKWKNASLNEQAIQKIIDSIEQYASFINLEQKKSEATQIIDSILRFSIFELKKQDVHVEQIRCPDQKQILQLNASLIKSTVGASSSFKIFKTDKNYLQLVNNSEKNDFGTAFLDFVLNPKKRYVIRLNYQNASNDKYYCFGIFKDSSKESKYGDGDKMSYNNSEKNKKDKIWKSVKGQFLASTQTTSKENFEIRIFLEDKKIQIASLPDYDLILELNDPNKIQLDTQYRFFLYIKYINDMIEITEIFETNRFDDDAF